MTAFVGGEIWPVIWPLSADFYSHPHRRALSFLHSRSFQSLDTVMGPELTRSTKHVHTKYGQVLRWRKPRIVIPYKHGDSKWIRRVLDPYDIQVFIKPRVTSKNCLSCLKDPIPLQHQSRAIYSISCGDCGKKYIRETGRSIAERISKHRTHTVKANASGGGGFSRTCLGFWSQYWLVQNCWQRNLLESKEAFRIFTFVKSNHFLTGTKGRFPALIQHHFIQKSIEDIYELAFCRVMFAWNLYNAVHFTLFVISLMMSSVELESCNRLSIPVCSSIIMTKIRVIQNSQVISWGCNRIRIQD